MATVVIVVLWAALAVFWIGNWIYVRVCSLHRSTHNQQTVTASWIFWRLFGGLEQQRSKLHTAITVFLGIKICATAFLAFEWYTLKNAGEVPHMQGVLYSVVRIAEMTSFLSVLMLISAGWGIIDNARARKWPLIALLAVTYAGCLAMELFLSFWFSIATAVALCIVLFFTFVLATDTMVLLTHRVATGTDAGSTVTKEDEEHPSSPELESEEGMAPVEALTPGCKAQARKQLTMISRFRFLIVLYIAGQLLCSVLNIFDVSNWVSQMVSQLFDLLLYLCIEFLFLLRKEREHGLYFMLEEVPNAAAVDAEESTSTGDANPTEAAIDDIASAPTDKP